MTFWWLVHHLNEYNFALCLLSIFSCWFLMVLDLIRTPQIITISFSEHGYICWDWKFIYLGVQPMLQNQGEWFLSWYNITFLKCWGLPSWPCLSPVCQCPVMSPSFSSERPRIFVNVTLMVKIQKELFFQNFLSISKISLNL